VNTFNFEESLLLGASHLESLVDSKGRTYFDVFLTSPAEAVTDWPDFVDLPSRYLEAAAMVEPILGRSVNTVPTLQKWVFSSIKSDGLAYRPDSPISYPISELFDQGRLLYMLVSWTMAYLDDKEICNHLNNLCLGLSKLMTFKDDYAYIKEIGVYFGGTLIRPLVQAGLVTKNSHWIDLAGKIARGVLDHSNIYDADGGFEGHVHGHMGTQAGILAYAIVTGNQPMIDRVKTIFNWARSISTSFGFVPELARRNDDLIACETCTIMDYLDVALLLARHVDERYWDVVEKTARNHLFESQIRDVSWLVETPVKPDENGVIRSRIRQRVLGSFAGWSSPHALLAYEEMLGSHWPRTEEMKPRYLGKIRALQNCCAGGGIRALHQVWSNIATFKDGVLSVNMLIDKRTPEALITSYIPYEGRARVKLSRDCTLRFRVSPDIKVADLSLSINGQKIVPVLEGTFINVGKLKTGDILEIQLPLPERTETVVIGNEGYQQYRFEARWKGDTVIDMQPDPANAPTGFTDLMNKRVRTYYGPEAPGRIYQRKMYETSASEITPSCTVTDERKIDWYRLV
jgi:hypothetical protein